MIQLKADLVDIEGQRTVNIGKTAKSSS